MVCMAPGSLCVCAKASDSLKVAIINLLKRAQREVC